MRRKIRLSHSDILGIKTLATDFFGFDNTDSFFLYKKQIDTVELSLVLIEKDFVLKSKTDDSKFYESKDKNILFLINKNNNGEIKSNIKIINKANDFKMNFCLKSNLPINLKKDNGRVLISDGKSIFAYFDSLLCFDNNKEFKFIAEYNYERINDCEYILSIILKEAIDSLTNYPIIIDPTMHNYNYLIDFDFMVNLIGTDIEEYSGGNYLGIQGGNAFLYALSTINLNSIASYLNINKSQIQCLKIYLSSNLNSDITTYIDIDGVLYGQSGVYSNGVYSYEINSTNVQFASFNTLNIMIYPDDNEDNYDYISDYYIEVEVLEILDSIAINHLPNKTRYYVNEPFDPTGLIVYAIYNNNLNEEIFDYVLNIPELVLGSNTITISYTENGVTKYTSFNINVVPQRFSYINVIENNLPENGYAIGTTLTLLDFSVFAGYTDNPLDQIEITDFEILNNQPLDASSNSLVIKFIYNNEIYLKNVPLKIANTYCFEDYIKVDVEGKAEVYYNNGSYYDTLPNYFYFGIYSSFFCFLNIKFDITSVIENYRVFKNAILVNALFLRIFLKDYISSVEIQDNEGTYVNNYNVYRYDEDTYYFDIPYNEIPINNDGYADFLITEFGNSSTYEVDANGFYLYFNFTKKAENCSKLNIIKPNNSSIYCKNPAVNIVDGSLNYEFVDLSIYKERFKIVLSHIYNSNNVDLYDDLGIDKGKGFKLNIEEFVFYKEEGNDHYIELIDSMGYKTKFVKAINASSTSKNYYDSLGLGLKIIYPYSFNELNYYLLIDVNNSKKVFDEYGRLIYIIDSHDYLENVLNDNGFAIKLEYDNNFKLDKIYNTKLYNNGNGEYLKLTYDNRLLSKIEWLKNNNIKKTVLYKYDIACRLTNAYRNEISSESKASTIEYNYWNLITSITDLETKLSNIFEYNEYLQVTKLSNGYISNDIFQLKDYFTFIYNYHLINGLNYPYKTSITSKAGTSFDFFIDLDGFITGSFEKKTLNSNKLYPDSKIVGKIIRDNFGSKYQINDIPIRSSSSSLMRTLNSVDIYSDGEEGAKTFVLNFFLKLKDNYSSDTLYVVLMFNDGSQRCFKTKINEKAYDSRQSVSLNFKIETEEDSVNLTNFSLYLVSLNDNNLLYEYSYLSIKAAPFTSLIVADTHEINTLINCSFIDSNGIYITRQRTKTINLNNYTVYLTYKDYYLSLDDLMYSCLAAYKNGDSVLKLITFNNKKIIYENLNNFSLQSIVLSNAYIFNGNCNFIVKQTSFTNDFVATFSTRFSGENIITTTTYEKDEEEPAQTKHIENITGDIIADVDIYGVEIRNYYDSYGNQIKKQKNTYSSETNIDKFQIIYERNYDSNHEKIVSNNEGTVKNIYEYDSFSNLEKNRFTNYNESINQYSSSNNYFKIQYDNNEEKIISFAIATDDYIYYENDIDYENGRVSAIRNGHEDIAIDYDLSSDKILYSKLNSDNTKTNLQEVQTVIASDYSKTILNKIYLETTEYVLSINSDKYGVVTNINDGYDTNFIYRDNFKGLLGSNEISEVNDLRNNYSIKYTYNNKAELTRIKHTYQNTPFLEIRKIGNLETTYLFRNFLMIRIAQGNDEKLSSTRVDQIQCAAIEGPVDETNINYNLVPFSVEFSYDDFQRLESSKYQVQAGFNFENIQVTYSYLNISSNNLTERISSINYVCRPPYNYLISYSYENNNISEIRENIVLNNFIKAKKKQYTYDSINRIASESFYSNNVLEKELLINFGESKVNSNFGKLTLIRQINGQPYNQNFYYDNKGQIYLISRNNVNYSYSHDKYGNYVSYKDLKNEFTLSYIKGNILSQVNSTTKNIHYDYLYNNIRLKKTVNEGSQTSVVEYYYDVEKLLAEYRTNNTYITYFYDISGIFGIRTHLNGEYKNYLFIKDASNNVIGIVNDHGNIVALYEYDFLGNCKVYDWNYNESNDGSFIGNINPIRWKSYYFDVETGFYYVNGRYYSPFTGEYLEASDLEGIEEKAENLFSLSRNGLDCYNGYSLKSYGFSFETTLEMKPDSTYVGSETRSWREVHLLDILLLAIQLAISVAMYCCSHAAAISGFLSVAFGIGLLFADETLLSSLRFFSLGIQTCLVAARCLMSLFSNFTYLGLAIFGGFISVSCFVYGVAEFGEAVYGYNFLKENGMSNEIYNRNKTLITMLALAVDFLGPKCFKKGTKVITSSGEKNIEDIEVGDEVLSFNEKENRNEFKPVTRIFRNRTNEWIHIILENNEEIICTPQHRFFEKNQGRIESYRLKEGSILQLKDHNFAVIKKVFVEEVEDEETYNFEVIENHTYYLKNNVLTHNGCGYYKLEFSDGKFYIGKGDEKRMFVSIKRIIKKMENKVSCVNSQRFEAANDFESFLGEASLLKKMGFIPRENGLRGKFPLFYNIINSPGKRFIKE